MKLPFSKPNPKRTETETPPESQYPLNHVVELMGGGRLVIGHEQGKQTIQVYHPSGSYYIMHPDGKVTSLAVGEMRSEVGGGMTLTVNGTGDMHVKGHGKMQIGGGIHVECVGDAAITVGKTAALNFLGDVGIRAKNISIAADGNFNVNVTGSTKVSTAGQSVYESGGPLTIGSGGTITVQAPKVDLNPSGGASGYTGGSSGSSGSSGSGSSGGIQV